jgi:hypothetical protein
LCARAIADPPFLGVSLGLGGRQRTICASPCCFEQLEDGLTEIEDLSDSLRSVLPDRLRLHICWGDATHHRCIGVERSSSGPHGQVFDPDR